MNVLLNSSPQEASSAWSEIADRSEAFLKSTASVLVGRDPALERLDQYVSAGGRKAMLVTGDAGFGKSALLATWTRHMRDKGHAIAAHFFSIRAGMTFLREAYLNLAHQIKSYEEMASVTMALGGTEEECRAQLYGLTSNWTKRSERTLVLVMDGLDEAEVLPRPPCPQPLPERVAIIASVRTSKTARPEELVGWTENSVQLPLDRVDHHAIRNWLISAGNGELTSLADDSQVVKELDRKTAGFPLYLAYLIEAMIHAIIQGDDPHQLVDASPSKFDEYVAEEFRRLVQDTSTRDKNLRRFFALLTVTLGPISESDLSVLTGLDIWDFQRLPWSVMRWLKPDTFPGGERSYHFAHPLLAAQFGRELRIESEQARKELVEHCLRWREQKNRYPMEYGPRHLAEANRWQELLELVDDAEFQYAQARTVPEHPDLPFKTLQAVIQMAFDRKVIPVCARLLLVHGRLTDGRYDNETPLDAIRPRDLSRAWTLAELSGAEDVALWHLLIAWKLHATDRPIDAQKTIARLRKLPCGPAKTIPLSCVALLLVPVANFAPEEFSYLEGLLLPRDGSGDAVHARQRLAEQLAGNQHDDLVYRTVHGFPSDQNHILRKIATIKANLGDHDGAVKAVERIAGYPRGRAESYAEVALAMAKQGHKTEASEKFMLAERYADMCGSFAGDWAHKLIAQCYAQAGFLDRAHAIAEKIGDPATRARALVAIALAKAAQGLSPLETLQEARDQADLAESATYALGEMAVAYGKIGDKTQCDKILQRLEDETLLLGEDKRDDALHELALLQWRIGEKERAERTRLQIRTDWQQFDTLHEIAKHRASEGDINGATAIVENFNGSKRRKALTDIAWIALDTGDVEAARNLVVQVLRPDVKEQRIESHRARKDALRDLALGQAEARDSDAAQRIAEYIAPEDRHTVWRDIGQSIASNGLIDDALGLADHVKSTSSYGADCILLEVATRQAREHHQERAERTLEQIENRQKFYEALGKLAAIYAAQDRIEQALACAQRIPTGWTSDLGTANSALARAYAAAGNVNAALDLVKTLGRSMLYHSTGADTVLVDVYTVLPSDGMRQSVLQATKFMPHVISARALARIAILQAAQGMTVEASNLGKQAREIGWLVSDSRTRAEVEVDTALVRILVENPNESAHEFDEAKEVAFDNSCLDEIRTRISMGLARIGRWDESLNEFREIGNITWRESALLQLMDLPPGPDLGALVLETFQKQGWRLVKKIAQTGDRQTFSELLPLGNKSLTACFLMASTLAMLHPECGEAIAEVMRDFPISPL